MTWVKDSEGDWINLNLMEVVMCKDMGSDYHVQFWIYAKSAGQEYILEKFEFELQAINYMDGLIQQSKPTTI